MSADRVLGRERAFVEERLVGEDDTLGFAPTGPAERRRAALRHARAQEQAQRERADVDGLAPAPPEALN